MVNGKETTVFEDVERELSEKALRKTPGAVVSGFTQEEIEASKEALAGPKEFASTTQKAAQRGTGKTLKRTAFKKKSRAPVPAKKLKDLRKSLTETFTKVKIKPIGKQKVADIIKAVSVKQRKSILSPTVFSLKISQNFAKKKKPISFFSKGRI